jgi:plasmid maintenance system antidote protein VapI
MRFKNGMRPVNDIVRERRGITADTAVRLARATFVAIRSPG